MGNVEILTAQCRLHLLGISYTEHNRYAKSFYSRFAKKSKDTSWTQYTAVSIVSVNDAGKDVFHAELSTACIRHSVIIYYNTLFSLQEWDNSVIWISLQITRMFRILCIWIVVRKTLLFYFSNKHSISFTAENKI